MRGPEDFEGEEETVTGEITAIRGPFVTGWCEIDIRTEDGTIRTLELTPAQLAEMTGETPVLN